MSDSFDDLCQALGLDGPALVLLGQGGMGRVYRFVDPELGRPLAVKVALGEAGGVAAQRLEREARITARLAGPGVVGVHRVGQLPSGLPWFTMDLAPGTSLAALRKAAKPGDPRLLVALLAVARVLARAHAQGIVHRDLKAANLLVDLDGRVTVLDWGLARVLPSAQVGSQEPAANEPALLPPGSGPTQVGTRIGTPACMSPEQAAGDSVDARADVWALGIQLWELLAGRPAYPGKRAPEVLGKVLAGPPPLEALEALEGAPRALVDLAEAALAPLPRRLADAGAFAAALEAGLREPLVVAPSPRRWSPWLMASLGGALALGLVGLWPSGAPSGEAETTATSEGLTQALTEAAMDAARQGHRHRAELLALDALEAGGPQHLRGLLLSPLRRPVRDLAAPMAMCEIGEILSPDASLVVCANSGHTTGLHIDEQRVRQAWRQEVELHQVQFQGSEVVLGQAPSLGTLRALNGADGAPLGFELTELGSGALAPSATTEAALGFTPGRLRVDRGEDEALVLDRRPAPCSTTIAYVQADGLELYACPGELLRFDPADGQITARWPLPEARSLVRRLRPSLGGERLGLITSDGAVGVLDLSTEELDWNLEVGERATTIGVSGDGSRVALALDSEVLVWSPEQPEHRWSLPGRGLHVSFDAQDRVVVVGSLEVERWRLPEEPEAGVIAAGLTLAELSWGAGGLVTRSASGQVLQWTEAGAVELAAEGVHALLTEPGRDRVVLVGATGVEIHELGGRHLVPTPEPCAHLAWLDETHLACAPRAPGPLVVDVADGTVNRSLGVPGTSWYGASGSGSGKVALLEWSAAVWTLEGGSPPQLRRHATYPWTGLVSLSPDGSTAVLTGRDGLHLLDLEAGTMGAVLPTDLRAPRVAWSPDGLLLAATAASGELRLFRAADGAELARYPGAADGIALIAFSPDGRRLALGRPHGLVEILDLSHLGRPLDEVAREIRRAWGD